MNTSDKLINDMYNLTVLPVPNMKTFMKGGTYNTKKNGYKNTKKQIDDNKNTNNKHNKHKNKKKTLKN